MVEFIRDRKFVDRFGREWKLSAFPSDWQPGTVAVVMDAYVMTPEQLETEGKKFVTDEQRIREAVWFDEETWREIGKQAGFKFRVNKKKEEVVSNENKV